jgi:uncharacterized protein (DUF2147 family)
MKTWKWLFAIVFTALYLSMAYAQETPVGNWTTIDDKTGQKRAVIHFTLNEGALNGTVEDVYPQPGDSGICSACPGEFKDKQIKGLQIIWGLKEKGEGTWEGCYILDAKSGKIYHVKMSMQGDKLHVRGYIGIALLGRTQIWERA